MKLHVTACLVSALFLFTENPTSASDPKQPNSNADEVVTVAIDPKDTTSIQRAIQEAQRKGYSKVRIPAGVYRIPKPVEGLWHLSFSNLKNIEIDATNVTFLFEGRDKRAMVFNDCDNVTFKGATLLRDIPTFSQGKVESIATTRTYADIRIDKGYPLDGEAAAAVIDIYQAGTRKLKPYVPDLYFAKAERVEPDLIRFHFRAPLDSRIPLAIGDAAAWRTQNASDISLRTTSRMKLLYITIKNGQGAGFQELNGEGGNLYSHCTITYAAPPAGAVDEPLLACSRDGLLSSCMRKGPIVENCLFEGLNDDCLNIAGRYGLLVGRHGNKVILNAHDVHFRGASFARVGDLLRFYDKRGALSGEAIIINSRVMPDYVENPPLKNTPRRFSDLTKAVYIEFTLDRVINGEVGNLVSNTNAIGNGFIIRNSTFRNGRGHGLFIRAGDGIIENCTIEGLMMGGIVVGPEMYWWNEGDYSRNLIIRKNIIRNVGIATQNWNSGITIGSFEGGQWAPLPGGHRNIQIEDNVFEDNRGVNLVLSSVIGAKVIRNTFIRPMSVPPSRLDLKAVDNDHALVWLRNSSDVNFEGNRVISPGSYMKELLDANPAISPEKMAAGFQVSP